ncbi:hypothetical protein BJX70DRAFT_292472 [Aspergillus crustosus]
MATLLITRYNDSMRLGQGYNSFLQEARVDNAVPFDQASISSAIPDNNNNTVNQPQVVEFSTGTLEKISDLSEVLNISAASAIKNGGIEGSSHSLLIDEGRILSADFNVLLSVKVVNQTIKVADIAAGFNKHLYRSHELDSASFHKTYGDSFISGLFHRRPLL